MPIKQERRQSDSAILLLLENITSSQTLIAGKIDELNNKIAENNIKCVECSNRTNNRLEPLEDDLNDRKKELSIGKKIINSLKSPTLLISFGISTIIFVIAYTNTLSEGRHYQTFTQKLQEFQSNTVTVDNLTNILTGLKKNILTYGN